MVTHHMFGKLSQHTTTTHAACSWVSKGVLDGFFLRSTLGALQHMMGSSYAGASGLGLYLGLPKYNRDRWAGQLPLQGASRDVRGGNAYWCLVALFHGTRWKSSAAATSAGSLYFGRARCPTPEPDHG